MNKGLHLVTNNAGLFQPATVEISTISLPCAHDGNWFETGLITQAGIEPIDQYATMAEAVLGHQAQARKFNCTNNIT